MKFTLDNKKYYLNAENDGLLGFDGSVRFVGYQRKSFLFISYWSKCFSTRSENNILIERWNYEMDNEQKQQIFNKCVERFKKYLINNSPSNF